MTKTSIALWLMLAAPTGLSSVSLAQVPVTAATDQSALLKSSDKRLAEHKKLAYDFWREVLEARHVELLDKYVTPDYIQHNPNVPTGAKGFADFFSRFPKKDIEPTVQRPLVDIVAEGNIVVFAFVDTRPIDPSDKTKTYTTTAFDMFRFDNNKIAEHWDSASLMVRPPQ